MDPYANPTPPQSMNYQPEASTVTIKEWLITMLVLAIPFVNLIMMFVWGFSKDTNPSIANFCKASLIWMAIGIGLSVLFFLAFGALLFSTISQMDYS